MRNAAAIAITDGMLNERPQFFTSGDISRLLNANVNRVRYLLGHRKHIRPVGRAGLVWLYDQSTIEAIAEELQATASGQTPESRVAT